VVYRTWAKNQTNLLWRKTLGKKTNIERRITAVFAVAHFFASFWNAICVLFFLSNEKPLKPATIAFKNRAQTAFQVGAFKDEMKQKLGKS